ncbi:MAG: M56 family metallopeptidase, partial [Planctomycetota bacterium]|nr:M56 family metallopeptidase [Planctomycetota bacterium]
MNELGISLLWVSMQITVLSLFTVAVYFVAGRRRPQVGAAATLSGLLLAAVLPIVAVSPWPDWMVFTDHVVAADPESATARESVPLAKPAITENPLLATDAETSLTEWGFSGIDPGTFATAWQTWESHRTAPVENGISDTGLRWEGWLAIVFLVGVAGTLLRLLVGLTAVHRMQSMGTPINDAELGRTRDEFVAALGVRREIGLREFEGITSAATIGWRRPLVLLPATWRAWKPGEQRAVLAHEIAHIAHHDFFRWVCAQLGLLFNFYHPLMHWLARRLRLEQELAADATAAQVIGSSRDYLRSLAELALRQSAPRLAWPARAFLPSSGTMARRIEMLRDAKSQRVDRSFWRRSIVVCAVLAVGLLVSSFRQPTSEEVAAQEPATPNDRPLAPAKPQQPPTKRVPSKSRFDLRYVPETTKMLIGMRPADAVKSSMFSPFIPFIDQSINQAETGIGVADIEQLLMVGFLAKSKDGPKNAGQVASIVRQQPTFILTTNRDVDFTKYIAMDAGETTEEKYAGATLYVGGRRLRNQAYVSPAPRTLIYGAVSQVKSLLDATRSGAAKLDWAEQFAQFADAHGVYLLDMDELRPMLEREIGGGGINPITATIRPLWKDSKLAIASVRFGDPAGLQASAWCETEDGAERVHNTAKALIPLAKNLMAGAKENQNDIPQGVRPAVATAIAFGETLLEDVKIVRKGNQVTVAVATEMGSVPVLLGLLLPAVQSAREAARRTQGMNNLKMIGLAMHNYHDINKRFPPAVLLGPDGKTKHSWRVALLPFLDEKRLHAQYNFDEPWDSDNNKKVLAAMPNVFRSPNSEQPDSTNSSYYALVGEHTAFGNTNEGNRIRTFTDGTSNTVLADEAK